MTRGRTASLGQGPADLQAGSHKGPPTGHLRARCHATGWGVSIRTHCGGDCERSGSGARRRVKETEQRKTVLLQLCVSHT